MKIYKIYAKTEFLFDGNDDVFVYVTKETKDIITGFLVDNFMGNYGICYNGDFTDVPSLGNKITIMKSNVVGWQECKDTGVKKMIK